MYLRGKGDFVSRLINGIPGVSITLIRAISILAKSP